MKKYQKAKNKPQINGNQDIYNTKGLDLTNFIIFLFLCSHTILKYGLV
nr:hypothetical protein [uncultured Pedobacter sp.]